MYKATNLAIHRTGLPVENKERLVGGAHHISTKYTALYYRSIRITPFGEMWWRRLSHARYHFHFSWKDRCVLHLKRIIRQNLGNERTMKLKRRVYLNKMHA